MDHVISDSHLSGVGQLCSCHTILARSRGASGRQKKREGLQTKRIARKDGGAKRPAAEIRVDDEKSSGQCRCAFGQCSVPDMLPAPMAEVFTAITNKGGVRIPRSEGSAACMDGGQANPAG